MLTVYSKPHCLPCEMLKRRLTRLEVEFETIDISKDEAALAKLKSRHFLATPVVCLENELVSGIHLGDPKLVNMIDRAKEQQTQNNFRM